MIRDGLLLYGSRDRGTLDELELAWTTAAARIVATLGGFPNRMDGDELDELVEVVFPFVSGSRWVADCPRCRGGVGCTVGYPRGCCYDCGGILTRISWPKKDVLDAGVATLELRPQESRHWTPMNESPQDLRFENIAHGFPIPSDEG